MGYIRTKYGIKQIDDDWELFCKEYAKNRQANTIEELCDEFIVVANGFPFRFLTPLNQKVFDAFDKLGAEITGVYGAIWIKLPNGAPRIESVAKMKCILPNGEIDWELL